MSGNLKSIKMKHFGKRTIEHLTENYPLSFCHAKYKQNYVCGSQNKQNLTLICLNLKPNWNVFKYLLIAYDSMEFITAIHLLRHTQLLSSLHLKRAITKKNNLNNLSSLIKLEKMIVIEWISIHLISLWLYKLEMVTQFMWSLHSCITQERRKS